MSCTWYNLFYRKRFPKAAQSSFHSLNWSENLNGRYRKEPTCYHKCFCQPSHFLRRIASDPSPVCAENCFISGTGHAQHLTLLESCAISQDETRRVTRRARTTRTLNRVRCQRQKKTHENSYIKLCSTQAHYSKIMCFIPDGAAHRQAILYLHRLHPYN